MKMFIIIVAVVMLTKVQAAPINSELTTQNTTSYSTVDITGLLATAQLHIIHTEQSVKDLERQMVSIYVHLVISTTMIFCVASCRMKHLSCLEQNAMYVASLLMAL